MDHLRVPYLQHLFQRHVQSLTLSEDVSNYKRRDIVTWILSGNLPHVGIVTAEL
ncbi:DUF1287 domain-containing protein [Pseudoalteromonas sp. NFXS39]|nr:DUF1287 domain-containing protein [Pseudoalteromonas shioyasakiensis]